MPDIRPFRDEHPEVERSWSIQRSQFREQARLALLARLEPCSIKVTDPNTGQIRRFDFKLLKEPSSPLFDLTDLGEIVMTGDLEFQLTEVPDSTGRLLIEQFHRAVQDGRAAMPSDIGVDHDGPPLPDNATEQDILDYTESLVKKGL